MADINLKLTNVSHSEVGGILHQECIHRIQCVQTYILNKMCSWLQIPFIYTLSDPRQEHIDLSTEM